MQSGALTLAVPFFARSEERHLRLVQEIMRFAVGANLVFALLLRPLPWGDHKDRPYTSVPMSCGSI